MLVSISPRGTSKDRRRVVDEDATAVVEVMDGRATEEIVVEVVDREDDEVVGEIAVREVELVLDEFRVDKRVEFVDRLVGTDVVDRVDGAFRYSCSRR